MPIKPPRASSQPAASDVPVEIDEESSGVYGETEIMRADRHQREQRVTLAGIRQDFAAHAKADTESFAATNATIAQLSSQHALVLRDVGELKGQIGEVSGGVTTLIKISAQQAESQRQIADAETRKADAAEAAAREDRRAERETNAKLAIARGEGREKIWGKVLAVVSAIVLAGIAALAGHAVK